MNRTFSTYKPCPLEGIFTPIGGSSSSSSLINKIANLPEYPGDIMANLEQDGNSIVGFNQEQGSSGSIDYPITVEVNYKYN